MLILNFASRLHLTLVHKWHQRAEYCFATIADEESSPSNLDPEQVIIDLG
jgi:hypothetical protein